MAGCRFLHDPKATEGFVGSALFANMFRFFRKVNGEWDSEKVIDVPGKEVNQIIKQVKYNSRFNSSFIGRKMDSARNAGCDD